MMGFAFGLAMAAVVHAAASPPPEVRVSSVLARGAGTLQLDQRYLLGDLIYTGSSAGRGLLSLQAGSGHVRMSGADADHPTSTTYVLYLDQLDIISTRPATGACTLTISSDQRSYRTLSCKGSIAETGEEFEVSWRGDGSLAEPVTP